MAAEEHVRSLEHSDERVRRSALEALSTLKPVALASHAATIVRKLEDSSWEVRRDALRALGGS